MNQAFLRALAPYLPRIAEFWTTAYGGSQARFELWKEVMGTLTDSDKNDKREEIISEYAAAGKKVLFVIPERAHPRLYLEKLVGFAKNFVECGGKLENIGVLFSGGVSWIVGSDGEKHSGAEVFGELNADAMHTWLRSTSTEYNELFVRGVNAHLETTSKNTGDQAWAVSAMIMALAPNLVVFMGPQEHAVRFALTIHKGLRTIEPTFRPPYKKRISEMKLLVLPIGREGGWEAETDLKRMTAAMDAFGTLDTDPERLVLFPNKRRGEELAERIGKEMYGEASATFIMNVTTLEDAFADPLFSLEFGDQVQQAQHGSTTVSAQA